jgi:hypothetical protein
VSTRVSVREVEGGYFILLACDKNIPQYKESDASTLCKGNRVLMLLIE